MQFGKFSMRKELLRWLLFLIFIPIIGCRNSSKINRYELVSEYNIENTVIDSLIGLRVGNPQFEFRVDMTGLQSFPEYYSGDKQSGTVATWTKSNPCNFNLGKVGLQILKKDGKEISVNDLKESVQKLNLWTGEIESMFRVDDIPVSLKTVCHTDYDMISVKISSGLIADGRLRIKIVFGPDDSNDVRYIHSSDNKNITRIISDTNNITILNRIKDQENYFILLWRNGSVLREVSNQGYFLEPVRTDSVFSFSCQFMSDTLNGRVQNFGETFAASKKSQSIFWNSLDENDFRKYAGSKDRKLKKHSMLLKYFDRIACSNSKGIKN
jgi:hypothetical protein